MYCPIKHRQRLDAENDSRVKLSSINLNFDDLCANSPISNLILVFS